ncbi:MAG TPA: YtxH domain-containing protein [Terriglobales bacterium]|nr:YtxH domain-containing protein [Terriglobales bacterium]
MKFLLGFGIGFALAVLYAPASGEETRRKLSEKLQDLQQIPKEKAEEMAPTVEKRAGEIGASVGRKAAESAVEAVREDVLGQNKPA